MEKSEDNTNKFVISPYEVSECVLIKAITNLHPGIGHSGDIVDLPVQKDNLGFPIIYSSSLKGALKSTLWNLNKDTVKTLLGSEPTDSEKLTSAMAILDAFTVAFPVRSLEGVYAFVTSPLLLKRFHEYLLIANIDRDKNIDVVKKLANLSIKANICQTSKMAQELLGIKYMGNTLIINEEISANPEINYSDDINNLEKLLGIEENRVVILNDNDALRAVEKTLVRVTRIAIDRKTKTAKENALWTEEYIPYNTIFVSVLLYSKTRHNNNSQSISTAKIEFDKLLAKTRNYLIIGGNETIGRGIVKIVKLETKGDHK